MHNCEMEYKKVKTLEYYKCKICGKYIDAESDRCLIQPSSKDDAFQLGSASFLKDIK